MGSDLQLRLNIGSAVASEPERSQKVARSEKVARSAIAHPCRADPGFGLVLHHVHAAISLEPSGVRTVSATSGPDARARLTDLAPDLVVVGRGETNEMTGGEVVRRLRTRAGKRPPVVVIGEPEGADSPADVHEAEAEYLPANVGVVELVHHIRFMLNHAPAAATPVRPALADQRMAEEIDRELQRSGLSGRPGVLQRSAWPS